jgi:hypothetical protein
MKDLTKEDFDLARKIVDDIVDNTEKLQIKDKMMSIVENYDFEFGCKRKKQFLFHLNTLFLNVLLNELTWRCDNAEERSLEARNVTKELNNR